MSGVLADALVGPGIGWMTLSPFLVLLAGTCVLMLLGSLFPRWPRGWYSGFSVVTSVVAAAALVFDWHRIGIDGPQSLVGNALRFDNFSLLASFAIVAVVGLVALLTDDFLRREAYDGPEVYALYLTSAIGAMVMVASNDMIVLFLGLETLSLSLYLLAASHRRRVQSQEAGLKYFILGGFASAFLLYGIALVYGVTGTTNITTIGSTLSGEVSLAGTDAMLLVGAGLIIVGLAFKVSAVPFHVWTPDVYQGAPSPVTAFMASAGKVAAFAALVRILVVAFPTRIDDWRPAVWALSVLTVVAGSILAVVQTNVKRMLAFSSISHAGFILVGVEAAGHAHNGDAIASVVTYLIVYSVLVVGSFAVITVVSGAGDAATSLDDFRGLAQRRPSLAVALTVFLLGQAGMPATSGFIAKFGVIRSAVETRSYVLAVVAMVAAVIAAFLYLRIMVSMWLDESPTDSSLHVPVGAAVAIAVAALFTVAVGVYPGWLLDAVDTAKSLIASATSAG